MENFSWVKQPPEGDKFTFLVDELGPNGNAGITNDPDKIAYNRQLLGANVNLDIGIRTALTQGIGIATAVPLGRYIVIIRIPKDESGGLMSFVDHSIRATDEELRTGYLRPFAQALADRWLSVRGQLRITYSPVDDNLVRLLKVESV